MLTNLNDPQKQAVLETQGPLLVLAGAGTGKTKVLTARIIHIINSHLATPLEILAVTFTNKAAAEMRHRIGDVIGENVHNLWIGTFHSIAAKITRRHAEIVGLKSDFTIIDQDDQLRLLKQILADLDIDTKQFPAKNYLNKISRNKDMKMPRAGLGDGFSDQDEGLPKMASTYRLYQNRLKSMNAADFGDLLAYNLEIFAKSPESLAYYQNKFRYVLVDEYQDTNNVQYQWLLRLVATHQNICAVGDDDQSIYSWRGANIANILRFEKDFKDAKIVRLEQNYRSSANILKVADCVISHNKERHGKTLWTDKKGGEEVKIYSFMDDRGEANFAVKTIIGYQQKQKYNLSQIAILVRAGYQTRAFEEALIKYNLPYKIIGGMKFYERMEVKDAICYLRVVCNLSDDLALSRIINTPKRGIGDTSINALYQKARDHEIPLFEAIKDAITEGDVKGKAQSSLRAMLELIERWRAQLDSASLSDLARIILTESGYIAMWQAENTIEAQGRLENIDEFVSSLNDFENITDFLEYVSLVEAKDDKNVKEAVNVMTVHGAKGLEFDLVFVPGLEDGLFPSGRSLDERDGAEEERRLFYVAITRAKKELILCYAKTRFVFGDYQQSMPSRFLKELPSDIKEIESGFEEKFSQYGGGYGGGAQYYSGGAVKAGGLSSYGNSPYGNKSGQFGASGVGARHIMPARDSNQAQNVTFYQKSPQNQQKFANIAEKFTKNDIIAKKSFDKSASLFGKRMFHQKFGYGKVVGIDGSKLEIEFEKAGKKVVMKDFVNAA